MMDTWDKNVCASYETNNQGCGVRDQDETTFGPAFNNKRGGVYALKWDGAGIAVYHFSTGSVPRDIAAGNPNPSGWVRFAFFPFCLPSTADQRPVSY